MSNLAHLLQVKIQLATPFDPGEGTAPPGSGAVTTFLQWLAWGVFIVAVGALLFIAAKIMAARRRGGDNSAEDLGSWVLGLAIAASASAITGALLTAAG
jgi:hypothetical protein